MADVLVLNADAQPLSVLSISTLSWQEAIKVYFLDRVSIIEKYSDWIITSPSMKMHVPSIIMLRDYIKVGKSVRFSRYNLFLRDDFMCQYCQKDFSGKAYELTLDHFVPRSHGGKTVWDNSVAACSACNTKKANQREMKPKQYPYKPTYFELAEKRKKFPIQIPQMSWNQYLQWPEDLIVLRNNNKIKNIE